MYSSIIKIYNFIVFKRAYLRYLFWKIFIKSGGKNVYIFENCKLLAPKGITLGNNIYINQNCSLDGHGSLIIKDNVMIGPYCAILTAEHGYKDLSTPMMYQPITLGKVVIDSDVWIGTQVVILPDVHIGKGSIVAANSVVTKNVTPYSIVAGSPARVIKKRK